LRAEQGGEQGGFFGEQGDIVGNQALQESSAIGTGNAENGAVGEGGDVLHGGNLGAQDQGRKTAR